MHLLPMNAEEIEQSLLLIIINFLCISPACTGEGALEQSTKTLIAPVWTTVCAAFQIKRIKTVKTEASMYQNQIVYL